MRRLLDAQHYRLAFWRDGEARNYRRFFDIGELGGLRVERPRCSRPATR
jgi:(1->4)-alpha-D-glucan 1-alpha-D-glucosylmutase